MFFDNLSNLKLVWEKPAETFFIQKIVGTVVIHIKEAWPILSHFYDKFPMILNII